ncbi:MAG: multidrug effflux MFS transporter [Geminicoccaceae bacterium]|nr:multidrug effflux MFS transporter [Geminicoccaceae bacterium]
MRSSAANGAVPPRSASVDARLLVVLIASAALAPFALQVFLPALPTIQASYAASPAEVQLTFSLSTLVVAFTSLLYGPLSDRIGRRPTMLFGIAVFVVGGLLCALAPSIEVLILARIVQAGGGGVGLVLARTMLRDLYPPERAAAAIAYVTMAMVVAPTLAPTIGGFVVGQSGWRAVFWLSTAVGVLLLLAAFPVLRETRHPLAPGTTPGPLTFASDFRRLVRSRRFVAYALLIAFCYASYFAFLAAAPYVVMTLMGLAPGAYGLLFITVSGTYAVGNFLAARLTPKVGIERMILVGTVVLVAACLAILAGVLLKGATVLGIFLPMAVMSIGQGFVMPNAQARLLGLFPDRAGSASGLAMFLQMGLAALAVQVVGSIQAGSALPMALGMFLMACAAAAAVVVVRRG